MDALAQRVNQLEEGLNGVLRDSKTLEVNLTGQLSQLSGDLTVMKNGVTNFADYVEKEKTAFGEAVAAKLIEHQQGLELIVQECKRKFDETQQTIDTLYGGHMNLFQETKTHVDQLTVRIGNLEATGTGTGQGGGGGGGGGGG